LHQSKFATRQRWRVEVTFGNRAHLYGCGTQRQWSDLAIRRTTPALLGLLLAGHIDGPSAQNRLTVTQTAWYIKPLPTFVDALASTLSVLRQLFFRHRPMQPGMVKGCRRLRSQWTDLLCRCPPFSKVDSGISEAKSFHTLIPPGISSTYLKLFVEMYLKKLAVGGVE